MHLTILFISTIILVQGSLPYTRDINSLTEDQDNLRTVGGHKVDITKVPYQTGLYLTIKKVPFTFGTCGGSLISHQHILTAAHCCQRDHRMVERIDAILGTNHLGSGGVRRKAETIFLHPKYEELSLKHDIAVITIHIVVFNNRILPVSLPINNLDHYVGSRALMSGYGKISDDDQINDKRVRAVTLTIIDNVLCKKLLDDPFDLIQIGDYNICSAASKKGSCDGDSGGPLVIVNNGIHILIGITSFGSEACDSRLPSVFVRVDSYLEWIKNITMSTDFRLRKKKKDAMQELLERFMLVK